MSTRIINHIYKLKRGTEEAIFEVNPVLSAGEPLVVLCDDGIVRLKIGDGNTEYVDLPFINQENDEALQQLTSAYADLVEALDEAIDDNKETLAYIDTLDSKIDALQSNIDSNKQAVEKDLSDLSDSIKIKKVSANDRVLSVSNEELSSKISLIYDKENTLIKLVGKDNADLGTVDASSFIVSGMLEDVSYDESNNTLTFTWNTASGTSSDTVELSNIIEPYSSGDGIRIDSTSISVKIDDTTEDFLVLTPEGLKVSGIQNLFDRNVESIDANSKAIEQVTLLVTEQIIPKITELENKPQLNEQDVTNIVNSAVSTIKDDIETLQQSVENCITEEEVDKKIEEASTKVNIDILDGGRITEWQLK